MKTIPMYPSLWQYTMEHSPLPHPILTKVADETARRTDRGMQISRDQGAFMHWLVKTTQARRCLEVGCFTGYSAIAVASALPPDGKLYTLDIEPETSKLAEGYFKEAGLAGKVELRLGDAVTSLQKLQQEFGADSFDFAFIDADKSNYEKYYESTLRLLKPGGVLIVDNVLWGGRVVARDVQTEDTRAIRTFNDRVQKDERVDAMILHISDGLYLIRKKTLWD